MVEVQAKAKKWGSSIGVVLPKSLVEEIGIKLNETLVIDVKKKHKVKEFFGLLKDWTRDTQEIKDEIRRGW